jgi:orotate phosphoribosyltransferase
MRVTDKEVGDLLREVGAWQTGHFLLSSGLHSNEYVQCQKVLQYPRYAKILAEALAKRLRTEELEPDVILGPAMGAVYWSVYVAFAVDSFQEDPVKAAFVERTADGDDFELRRGIQINEGDKVLVVEDVITTGGSAKKVINLVKNMGAEVVGVGSIIDRSPGVDFAAPFFPLFKAGLSTYAVKDCPLCHENVPLVKPGSSKPKK